jgi:hypothetical protein
MIADLLGRATVDATASIHHGAFIRSVLDVPQIVGNGQMGQPQDGLGVSQEVEGLGLYGDVQRADSFVRAEGCSNLFPRRQR